MARNSPQLAATERAAVPESNASVVVFLHGVGCERNQFAAQLDGLDPRLQLISLDLPGHGQSPPMPTGGYGVASMAEAVQTDLAERGIDDVVVIGHSAGGLIALMSAVKRPDVVRGVALIDTTIALTEAELQTNRERSAESDNSDWRRYFMASMTEAWGDCDNGRASVFRTLERTPSHVARLFWHDVLAFASEDLWRGLTVPALYIRSKRQTDLRLLQALNPLISTVDLRPHGGGHWPHVQCPDVLNEALHRFLASLTLSDG